jgi:hypothetical protein
VFLTADELEQLTGYRRPGAQIRWLRSRAIRHYVNGAGHPVVARAWLDSDHDLVPIPVRPNLRAIQGGA